MQVVDGRLVEANKKTDSILDKAWKQAEENLKKLEQQFVKGNGKENRTE